MRTNKRACWYLALTAALLPHRILRAWMRSRFSCRRFAWGHRMTGTTCVILSHEAEQRLNLLDSSGTRAISHRWKPHGEGCGEWKTTQANGKASCKDGGREDNE